MKIYDNACYAIINKDGGDVYDWFKNRVYLGRWVINAYNQIKNKDGYKIYLVGNVLEVNNE